MKEKKIRHIYSTIKDRARKATRKCLFEGCPDSSIKAHLLQENGIITQISENNRVVKLATNLFQKDLIFFEEVGKNEAFAFSGFCPHHDNQLFREIEQEDIDFSSYKTRLLFSYRALMNEIRKKEIDSLSRVLNSFTLKLYLDIEYMENRKRLEELGIQDMRYYEKFFLANLSDSSKRDFIFLVFELPRIEICSSGVFTYETKEEMNYVFKFENYKWEKPFTSIYFHLLPQKDKTIMIIGCLEQRIEVCWNYLESFKKTSTPERLKIISDLLLYRLENWLCSPKWYKSHFKRREKDIIRIFRESFQDPNERRKLEFNLFDFMQ